MLKVTGVNMKVEARLDDGRGVPGHAIPASGRGLVGEIYSHLLHIFVFNAVFVFVSKAVFDVAIPALGRGLVGGIYSHLLHIFCIQF